MGGFATMAAPQLTRDIDTKSPGFDIAHIHLARDLVTVPAALKFMRARIPYVIQTHGMIDSSERLLAKPLDVFATKPILRHAKAVLTLTDREIDDISTIESSARTIQIANGISIGELAPYIGRQDMVLFLARLHERKRPLAFIEMAVELNRSSPTTHFVLAGPDEGEGKAVQDAIMNADMGDRLRWIGAVSPNETADLMEAARAYVLPSVGEVFPMTILEALRAGTPVVTTESLGIAADCADHGAALITDGSAEQLAAGVTRILGERKVADGLRSGGLNYLRDNLDINDVAKKLESIYLGGGGNDA